MESGIRHLAGRSFKVFLKKHTQHPFKAVLAGLILTAILQSSSIVNLLVLAFVGARILTMHNAIAVLLGANLGSTVYNWIVVFIGFKFDIQSFAFPIMAIATIGLIFFQERKKIMHWTRLSFGLALLFLGLANIKTGVEDLVLNTDLSVLKNYGNIIYVIAGFVITAIVQSSSTMVVVALAALNAGAIGFDAAACLVIGSESGTAIKTIIAAAGTSSDKKRVALGNFVVNITSSIVAFLLLHQIIYLIQKIVEIKDPLIGVVFFQSIINLTSIFIFYPLLKPFSKWLENRYEKNEDMANVNLNKLVLNDTEESVLAVKKETLRLIKNIIYLNKQALEISNANNKGEETLLPGFHKKSYSENYEQVKKLNGEIIDFCIELQSHELKDPEKKQLTTLLYILRMTMNASKSIKDIRHNIKEYRDSADDVLYGVYKSIRNEEDPYFIQLNEVIFEDKNHSVEKLNILSDSSKKRHEEAMQAIFKLSSTSKINNIQVATLLNVFEGIMLSNDALTTAARELFNLNDWNDK